MEVYDTCMHAGMHTFIQSAMHRERERRNGKEGARTRGRRRREDREGWGQKRAKLVTSKMPIA